MKVELFVSFFHELSTLVGAEHLKQIMALSAVEYKQTVAVQRYQVVEIAKKLAYLQETQNSELLRSYKYLLIAAIIIKNWSKLNPKEESLLAIQYQAYLQRIYRFITDKEDINLDNMDIFWKELAIARLQIFPLYAGVAEFYSGFGIRQGLTLNIKESLRFLFYLSQVKFVRKAYYKVHTHTPIVSHFSEEGWRRSYLQLAQMLIHNKAIRGVIRGSWFFDPEIKKISPHLSYLQALPLQHGAKAFYIGPDKSGCAFVTSKNRLELYRAGEYTPKNYLLVWPREAIICWANSIIK
jgi:hypothetical protein